LIASKARAAQLIEQIADKHGISVPVMLCSRAHSVTPARAEIVHALIDQLGWSQRTVGAYLGRPQTDVRYLFLYHKKFSAQIARLGGAAGPADPDGRIRELEAELARLAGTLLCEALKRKLGLRLRCAIGLAIITEAYPRVVRGPVMLQLYDDACAQLGYGHANEGANYRLMDKNMSDLNAHFVDQGWPAPARPSEGRGARQLSDAAAEWMAATCGAPRWSVVLAAREDMHELCVSDAYGSLPVRAAGAM
jgi:hypothetical protein